MKLNFMAFAVLLAGAIQNSTSAEGTIVGRVLRAGTGEPIPNTPVTLISSSGLSDSALAALLDQISQQVTLGLQGQGGGGNQNFTIQAVTNLLQTAGPGVGTQGSVLTDRTGHFAFTNVPRGRYTVWVQRFNYYGPILNGFPTSTASVTISYDPSKPQPSADLFLTQGLAITGRVLDSRGQPPPAPAWNITAYRATFSDGKPLWNPILSRPLDDRGEYRLSPLPPGEYYVGVTPPPVSVAPPGQDPAVRTFFPGASEPSQATKLILKGTDVPNVDFSLRTAPSTLFKISGVAANPSAVANADGVVDRAYNAFTLMPVESNLVDSFAPNTFPNMVPAGGRTAGEFEIRNLRPGLYELFPLPLYSGMPFGRATVDIRGSDAVGVRISTNPVVMMTGRVVIAEANPQRPVRMDTIRIVLKPLNAPPLRGAPITLSPDANGEFTLSGPSGALVSVLVTGLPETAFISDIRTGNTSVLNNGLALSPSSDALQVIIDATRGGTVEVSVRTADGKPGLRATVVLVPPEDRRQHPMNYKIGTADTEGRVTLRGVAPGSYTAFAWESVPETAWLNNEFLSKYQEQGTGLTVMPGAPVNMQLKWIPFDADLR